MTGTRTAAYLHAQSCGSPNLYRLIGGRTRHNQVRQWRAKMRLVRVVALLGEVGMARGYQTTIARRLGVAPSTISRDMSRLHGMWRRSPQAIRPAETDSGRHVEPEQNAVARPEQPSPPAGPPDAQVAPPLPAQHRSDPVPQVATWLPAPRRSRAGRLPRVWQGHGATAGGQLRRS